MSETINYSSHRADQITRIRKFANNAIVLIWTAGFTAILILTVYFLFFTNEARGNTEGNKTIMGSKKGTEEILFTDKTTLVNIALRMQTIPDDTEMESGGTISINKIIHDQKLNKIKKQTKADPTVKLAKPGFSVKAVPK